jgi:hypothetical protein
MTSAREQIRQKLLEVGFWDVNSQVEAAHLEQTLDRILSIVASLPSLRKESDDGDLSGSELNDIYAQNDLRDQILTELGVTN